ncbi:SDR family oxidoreductase [Pseudomaricurvus alkylphenolicus]|uniref:SDR family oxidoreductase n=1 Tax=Pseudomaricurvus alkylphenolicus TaxID=1306991 RepID=UPI0014204A34|nr:SDR family oxidoreductase [Pseudomaricurvus alkylphenolicus]NIB44124.1 SDR family oxidoreductase [Pseudomaricurvus alkylphenolicus]
MPSTELIVITGGTKGIGKALVHKFAAHGFDIATCARNPVELAALKEEVEKTYGVQVTAKTADLSQKEQVLQFSDHVLSLGNSIGALINNSGRFLPGSVLSEAEGQLEELIDTNLLSAYWLIRALVPTMTVAKRGYVFNICSTASLMAYNSGASYSISKFAMYGMSKNLREELKPNGIKVSSVIPGPTLTTCWEEADIPDQRFIDPADIAKIVYDAFDTSSRTVVEDIIIRPQLGDL